MAWLREHGPDADPVQDRPGAGRRRVLVVGAAAGAAIGVGLSLLTGAWAWLPLGAVGGIGVGDLVAGGRR